MQRLTAIVLPPHKTLLHPLPDSWILLYVKFVPYMNRAFSLGTAAATLSRGTQTRARATELDITAEDAFCLVCDELKRSFAESGCLDDAMKIAS